MLRQFAEKLAQFTRTGNRSDQISIAIAFLIISTGVGVLAWRSYQLSLRMERDANTLAVQYAAYAAEITARRVDAAVRDEMAKANEEWQQVERNTASPTYAALQEWIASHDWIVAAIYVPDYDPTSTLYVAELGSKADPAAPRMTQEFFTPSGTLRYTYDPIRLIGRVRTAVRQQPLVRAFEAGNKADLQQQADVALIGNVGNPGLGRIDGGFLFISALAPPLAHYGVRALVHTSYVGSGWGNQRVVSFWVSLLALALTAMGAYLALRGLRREADTMKIRSALIANVSHELRTPLSMIRLGAETLQLGGKLRESERKQIEDSILREVLHLSHLVENVLDVARIQNKKRKALALVPVMPRDLVDGVVSTYGSWIGSKGFEVSVNIEEGIEEQMWDREAVSRALLNLIDNAIKYSADDQRIDVVLRATNDHVIIEVRDRGVGIAAKDLEKIFEPYFRARFSDTQTRRGAGLGLTLVEQIVAAHGGRMEVDSEPGKGSAFRMLFPRPPRLQHVVHEEKLTDGVVRT